LAELNKALTNREFHEKTFQQSLWSGSQTISVSAAAFLAHERRQEKTTIRIMRV
jgi:hypothetical protein